MGKNAGGMNITYFETGSEIPERENRVKKTTYAVLGVLLIVTAALSRLHWGGSLETVGLILLGLALIVASADVPIKAGALR